MTHIATLPARVLSRPSLGSGPIVSGGRSGGTHGPDGPDGGVPRLVTPLSPGDPGKGGRTSLPPEPGLLRERFSLLGPLLVLLKS